MDKTLAARIDGRLQAGMQLPGEYMVFEHDIGLARQ